MIKLNQSFVGNIVLRVEYCLFFCDKYLGKIFPFGAEFEVMG